MALTLAQSKQVSCPISASAHIPGGQQVRMRSPPSAVWPLGEPSSSAGHATQPLAMDMLP